MSHFSTLDYLVELRPCGSTSPYPRFTSIRWDEEIEQDWQDWITSFNEHEPEPYEIVQIIPCYYEEEITEDQRNFDFSLV